MLTTGIAAAADGKAPKLDGTQLGLAWALPFLAILFSIALFPLIAPRFWHDHFGKVAAVCALAFLGPAAAMFGVEVALYELIHTLVLEYVPFVVLLLALYVIAGGIRITGEFVGTPGFNTGLLAFGTVIASWVGTTGACMLLIQPAIRANHWRKRNAHVFVFFIFLVGNVGGSLTPLGDPPLFIGFLEGVEFFWTTSRLFLPMLVVAVPLLIAFHLLDSFLVRREEPPPAPPVQSTEPVGLAGAINMPLLLGVIVAVLASGAWHSGIQLTVFHTTIEMESLLRTVALLALTALSWRLTDTEDRRLNGFDWFPIVEVAKLFIAIFVTIVPVLAIIRAGEQGAAAGLVGVLNADGQPDNVMYFWITGILSSFLDNAPTYLLFFNFAGGDPAALMGPMATTLAAISAGAVFMGANSYIGNAPNFMVKSVCEGRGIVMPSFFGFMAWGVVFLVPPFVAVTMLFFG